MGHIPEVGDLVGDFALPGGELIGDNFVRSDYKLCRQRGNALVLAFYPAYNTPICTAQLCSYSDALEGLSASGARVWGISPQTMESHEGFARKRGMRMPLLADIDRTVIRTFGIAAPLIGLRRAVFIIAPDGTLHWKHVTALGATFPSVRSLTRQVETIDLT
ncbi:peroxiredoxin family protein [Streptomyces sp. H34-S4]|uniref:peroxiredoxin family protein n=1 Tax=Streptomyces sp. H34-S4 TaxID=2996463 RepID=UPI002270C516|nr:redoxin domain-containing protein [Streptomyces sp. H34-S4]MCY0937558.1 redoxin domain-containing protein [Streptomyces sp. H34-S4]